MFRAATLCLVAALIAVLLPAWARTEVSLQGMLSGQALLLVGGGTLRAVAPDETWQDVKGNAE
ncbi:MAG: hypothetical protein LBE78_03235 [Burkholderiaceae bacterium]|jgi:intracellular septation protein A|nr:hypothetical protein [Burkholderiaceae bacterium]